MRKILLTLTIISVMTKLSAQECKYEEYYNLIASGNQSFSEKNYKEAENDFKLAFSKTDFPLGKDLELALSIAQKRKNSEWANEISIYLAKGGVPLRYFEKLKSFKWHGKFKEEYKTYSDYYNENYKPELREKLNSLIDRDAIFTQKLMDWNYGTINLTAENASQEANAILSELKTLTEKYGFPSEQIMGYNYVRRLNRVENYKIGALMIHLYKYGELVYENEIPNIICSGILHPNYQQTLKKSRGFGNSTGIEQEMKARFEKNNKKKN